MCTSDLSIKCAEHVDDAGVVRAESSRHVLGRLQREAIDEDRQPAQQPALGFGQQVVAPVDRRSQGLVTRQLGAGTAAEHTTAVIESGGDLLRPIGRGLARAASSIASGSPSRWRRMAVTALAVAWPRGGTKGAQLAPARRRATRIRTRGRGPAAALPGNKERTAVEQGRSVLPRSAAARGSSRGPAIAEQPAGAPEEGWRWRRSRARSCRRRGGFSRREKPAERLSQTLPRLLAHAEHRGDGLRHERLVAQWRQIDPPGTVIERSRQRSRHLQSEARLAGTASTHQRQQARRSSVCPMSRISRCRPTRLDSLAGRFVWVVWPTKR